jgi:uncharacterized membrane protein
MRIFRRFFQGQLPLGRIEAFSDGVFAIIVTLLVLELKAPVLAVKSDVHELGKGLLSQLPMFLSWLISFIIVCKFWLNHHYIFGLARSANYGMVWLNSIFLMFQSFVPFPCEMMGEYPTNSLAVSFFGVVMALNTILFLILQMYIVNHCLKPELVGKTDPHIVKKAVVGPTFYLLGATAAWFYTPLAFVLYMITPLFYITPPALEVGG